MAPRVDLYILTEFKAKIFTVYSTFDKESWAVYYHILFEKSIK